MMPQLNASSVRQAMRWASDERRLADAGAAIEGVIRQEEIETSPLAVDTHGYTDFAMLLARLLGFDLCPRLKALKQRRLFLPQGSEVPESVKTICSATLDLSQAPAYWDKLVHLAAGMIASQ